MITSARPSATAKSRVQLRSSRRNWGMRELSLEVAGLGLEVSNILRLIIYSSRGRADQIAVVCVRAELDEEIWNAEIGRRAMASLFTERESQNGQRRQHRRFRAQDILSQRDFSESSRSRRV